MQPFVHLHNHTAYSLLDGAAKIDVEVARAKELGQPALAITDHGVMYGVVDFYRACKKAGIKPIIGCEVYVAPSSRFDKRAGVDDKPYHLILLVKNKTGYSNLCKLVSLSSIEGFYRKPRIDHELLEKHHEGLIALSACLGGELPRLLLQDDYEAAKQKALWHRNIFGEDNYYLELQNHGLEEQERVNRGLRRLSQELDIPLVATNDNHYVYREDAKIQDVMLCIQTGKTLADPNRMHFHGDAFYLKSYDEMLEALPEDQEALDNTLRVAEQCNFDFDFTESHLPLFTPPEGETQKSYLERLAFEGLSKRYIEPTEEAKERLCKELAIIDSMGYNAYFLIVWDFIDFAKKEGIFVGPGRGSAAGSLVSYALGITDIDPLKYSLLFERFLNPERVNMPDIDIDFCYERRGEVIDYVTNKYGSDKVSQIITFGTMAAKAAIRDAGRVMDVPIPVVDKICKAIPKELGITLDRALQASDALREMMDEDAQIKELIDIALKLEGLPRHAGTHAAGVVISEAPLDCYLPLQKTADGALITQFAKENVEDIGLLKMDFLGLRTLTVVNKTIETISKFYHQEVSLDKIDESDKATYAMLSKGEGIGVFQMEGSGLRAVLKDLKPTSLEDIIALVALYRPGPLGSGMVEDFIARKHGEKPVEYLHPLLEDILKPTYGVILYQEQVMQIASQLAGFSLGEADLLRRAMGKKNPEIIASLEAQFIEGARNHGIDEKIARRIFELIGYFAGYGFNKSHSAAYGRLALETAYLKCHYPKAFMAELMNAFIDNIDKVSFYIEECRRMGIKILPPDVNESGLGFTVTQDGIRFGLAAIKSVGDHPAEAIVAGREKRLYRSFQDFLFQVDLSSGFSKRVVEALIKCGAFEAFGVERSRLMAGLDDAYAQAQATQKAGSSDQVSLFDMLDESAAETLADIPLPEVEAYTAMEILGFEKHYLGIYISGHPLQAYETSLAKKTSHRLKELDEQDHDRRIVVGGMLIGPRFQTTKRGDLMAYATLETLDGNIEVLVFPQRLNQLRHMLEDNAVVTVRGRLSVQDDTYKIFAEEISPLQRDEEEKKEQKSLFIRLSHGSTPVKDAVLAQCATKDPEYPVYFYFALEKKYLRLDKPYWVDDKPDTERRLKELAGVQNVCWKEAK